MLLRYHFKSGGNPVSCMDEPLDDDIVGQSMISVSNGLSAMQICDEVPRHEKFLSPDAQRASVKSSAACVRTEWCNTLSGIPPAQQICLGWHGLNWCYHQSRPESTCCWKCNCTRGCPSRVLPLRTCWSDGTIGSRLQLGRFLSPCTQTDLP